MCNEYRKVFHALPRISSMFLLTSGAFLALLVQPPGLFAFSTRVAGAITVDVKIPKEGELGKSVKLECTWKLTGNSTLYTVKWYKNEYEFFTYNPDNRPQITLHEQNGVNIDMKHSTKNEVRLTGLSLNSTGQYKCEVSTGSPFFATNYRQGNLTVISLPSQGPEITGLSGHYTLGENVTANCTSWPSVPKARIHWTVNNKSVSPEYVVQYPPLEPIYSQGTPNSLGLRFQLDSHHLYGSDGMLRVRCVAHVGSRRFETERHVQLGRANNQRITAGDLRSGGMTIAATHSAICIVILTVFLAT